MATKPIYKWWETDDKTKRVYTEVLVEKLTKPNSKKTENPSDKKKSCRQTDKRELVCPPRLTVPPNSPTDLESQNGSSLENSATTPERKSKKYQFETITMETLAKYDYIKSPKKQSNTANAKNETNIDDHSEKSVIDQEWEKQLAKSNSGRATDKNQKSYYEELIDSMKTSQKPPQISNSNTKQKYNYKEKSSESDTKSNTKDDDQPFSIRKPNLTQSKLAEIPEYDSSDVQETSTEEDDSTSDGASSQRDKLKNSSGVYERKEAPGTKIQDKLKSTNNNVDMSILRGDELLKFLSDKYVSLCERVEMLEFKLFEFCDDIYKLKKAVGVKTKEEGEKPTDDTTIPEQQIQLSSPRHSRPYYKHALTLAANRDLLTNRYQSKSLLLKQQSSPSKVGKSDVITMQAVTNQNSTLAKDLSNKDKDEKEFTEDEIQEILRSSKVKYIDKKNYLEELGYSVREND